MLHLIVTDFVWHPPPLPCPTAELVLSYDGGRHQKLLSSEPEASTDSVHLTKNFVSDQPLLTRATCRNKARTPKIKMQTLFAQLVAEK